MRALHVGVLLAVFAGLMGCGDKIKQPDKASSVGYVKERDGEPTEAGGPGAKGGVMKKGGGAAGVPAK